MAEFDIIELEGQRRVRMRIADESVRAEAGAMSHMSGQVEIFTPPPSPGAVMASLLSDEPMIRPRYHGTGEVLLEASFGGYHVFDVDGEPWVLERGAYWASDGRVKLGVHREPFSASFWAGDGLVNFQTKVSGRGRVVLNAPGPVEEVRLDNSRIAVEGKLVIARTLGLKYTVKRPTRSLIGFYLSREAMVRSYSGTGRVLICVTPFWSERLFKAVETRPRW